MGRWQSGLAGLVALVVAGGATAADLQVDTALVIAMDVSLSVDDGRYRLQRDGTAAAFEDAAVIEAITAGPAHAVAVMVLEFSDPDRQLPVVPWVRLASAADARALAGRMRALRRSSDGVTGLADALLAARDFLAEMPYTATRKVVDLSSDGFSNAGTDMAIARAAAEAAGLTVNGLPILTEDAPWLDTYYQEYVITGPDAFTIVADDPTRFAEAMRRKLVRELRVSLGTIPNRRSGGEFARNQDLVGMPRVVR